MIALTYTLYLRDEVLATSLDGDPNSATTFPYIPGSLIRGALISRYLSQTDTSEIDFATNSTTRALFLNGQVRYLPAYLNIGGQRTLPTGLSWYKEKSDELNDKTNQYPVVNKANPEFEAVEFEEQFTQPKQVPPQFCILSDDYLTLHAPETVINIHNQRERRAGRATERDGAVFRYEALAPRQRFSGVILIDDEKLADQLETLLTGTLSLGGSRSAGYGRAKVVKEDVQRVKNWTETDAEIKTIQAGRSFFITLLSDTILCDENGQYTDMLSAKHLNLPSDSLKLIQAFKKNALVGGFNRKWGLPLPQTLAIQAGSVFCFEATQEIPADNLKTLLWQGIGQRRTEGFGRLAINWPDASELTVQQSEKDANPEIPGLKGTTEALIKQMNDRLLRREADLALSHTINQTNISKKPRKSQLGSVRIAVRQALQEKTAAPLTRHLANMQGKVAGKQFENGRISGDSLLNWLETKAQNPEKIWGEIGVQFKKYVGQEAPKPDEALAIEYTLRFIDGVLAKAAKEGSDNE